MGFIRSVPSNPAWRSYAYPAMQVSGTRLGDWRTLASRFATRGAWSSLAHPSGEGEDQSHSQVSAETHEDLQDESQDMPN